MIHRIVIPQAFENMEEATIGEWSRREGDSIRVGEALCVLITEKTTFDLPAESSGTLLRIASPEKSIVPVGTIIGLIGEAGDEMPDVAAENAALQETLSPREAAPSPKLNVPSLDAAPTTSAPVAGGRLRATPAARRAARERGVELEDVAARFPAKVLSEDDVNQFADG